MNSSRRPTALRFSPPAWAKLLYWRDAGKTEVCGFGIAAADDLLLVTDVALVRQECTWTSAALDDESVADFFEAQVALGRRPEQVGRLFIHTHPGNSATPSATDELTFGRVFGGTEWAVMLILARGGDTYARLRYHVGPGIDVELAVEREYTRPFAASDEAAWQVEYERNVRPAPAIARRPGRGTQDDFGDNGDFAAADGWLAAGDEFADWDLTGKEDIHDDIFDW